VPRPELDWAAAQPIGTWELPEFHVEKLVTSSNLIRMENGDEPLPHLRAVASPGHTPGHFAYHIGGTDGPLLFSGDAAKNELELMSGNADMTLDADESRRSIDRLRDGPAARRPSRAGSRRSRRAP
jgi:N-acyl homoserine lactone hydrolase